MIIEYGVMLFEHNFNMNNISFNDICKIIEDLKYEKYNLIEKKYHNSNLDNFYYQNGFYSSGKFSPKSYRSIDKFGTSLRSQKIESAIERSPEVKPGKYVFLNEDPYTNEVIIKVNKETYINQIKNNDNALIFRRSGSKKKRYSQNQLKPIEDQTEETEPPQEQKRQKPQKIQKVVSVDEILDKLKYSPKRPSKIESIKKSPEREEKKNRYNNYLKNYTQRQKHKYQISTEDINTGNSTEKTIYVIKKPEKKHKKIIIKTLKSEGSDLSDYNKQYSDPNTTEEVIFKGKNPNGYNYLVEEEIDNKKYHIYKTKRNSNIDKKGIFLI